MEWNAEACWTTINSWRQFWLRNVEHVDSTAATKGNVRLPSDASTTEFDECFGHDKSLPRWTPSICVHCTAARRIWTAMNSNIWWLLNTHSTWCNSCFAPHHFMGVIHFSDKAVYLWPTILFHHFIVRLYRIQIFNILLKFESVSHTQVVVWTVKNPCFLSQPNYLRIPNHFRRRTKFSTGFPFS